MATKTNRSTYKAAWYQRNRERIRATQARYYQRNKEQFATKYQARRTQRQTTREETDHD